MVSSPESRAQLANRRETTVVKRMASGYGGDVVKLVEVAARQNTYGAMEMRIATSAFILVHPCDGFVGHFKGASSATAGYCMLLSYLLTCDCRTGTKIVARCHRIQVQCRFRVAKAVTN